MIIIMFNKLCNNRPLHQISLSPYVSQLVNFVHTSQPVPSLYTSHTVQSLYYQRANYLPSVYWPRSTSDLKCFLLYSWQTDNTSEFKECDKTLNWWHRFKFHFCYTPGQCLQCGTSHRNYGWENTMCSFFWQKLSANNEIYTYFIFG